MNLREDEIDRKPFDRPLPEGVRIAHQADEPALYAILIDLYKDNFLGFAKSDNRVWDTIQHCCRGGGGVAAVIEADGRIVASTGIVFSSMWYSDDPYLSELWLFVHPAYRKFGYAERLADFCYFYRDQFRHHVTGRALPLITSVTSHHRLSAKMRWWSRWAKLVGGIFVIDGA